MQQLHPPLFILLYFLFYLIIIIRLLSLVQPTVLTLTHRIIDCTVWVAKKIAKNKIFFISHMVEKQWSLVMTRLLKVCSGIVKQHQFNELLFSE